MDGSPLFEHPVQTIKAISLVTGISRTTILKACKAGPLKGCSYQSGETWLIDTNSEQFQKWLSAHPTQWRVRWELARKRRALEEQQTMKKLSFRVSTRRAGTTAIEAFPFKEAVKQAEVVMHHLELSVEMILTGYSQEMEDWLDVEQEAGRIGDFTVEPIEDEQKST
jgi:hypothetical protein